MICDRVEIFGFTKNFHRWLGKVEIFGISENVHKYIERIVTQKSVGIGQKLAQTITTNW